MEHESFSGSFENYSKHFFSKPLIFNGDTEQLSWWKDKLYIFLMSQEENHWDII